MSDTPESPPSPPKVQLHEPQDYQPDLWRDVVLWRRNKQVNVVILLATTALWTVMEVYGHNFITVLSWAATAVVVCFFFWGNIHRLLKKEAPDLSELEVSEGTAMDHANLLRSRAEDAIRLMFHVSTEREWSLVFAGVVFSLYLISIVAKYFDLLTLCCIGVVGAMTVPVIYVKNEHRIRGFVEKARVRSKKLYAMFGEKLEKIKSKIAGQKKEIIKEKKLE